MGWANRSKEVLVKWNIPSTNIKKLKKTFVVENMYSNDKGGFFPKNPVAEKLEAFGGANDGMNKVHIGGKIFIAKRPKPNTKPKESVDFPELVNVRK